MEKSKYSVLQGLLVFFGLLIFYFLIRIPMLEGRAKNLDLFQIYSDPLIIYVYLASIVFFVGLIKTLQLLGFLGKNDFLAASGAIRVVKICSIILGVAILAAAVFVSMAHHTDDDPAGFIALAMVLVAINIMVFFAAKKFENKFLRS